MSRGRKPQLDDFVYCTGSTIGFKGAEFLPLNPADESAIGTCGCLSLTKTGTHSFRMHGGCDAGQAQPSKTKTGINSAYDPKTGCVIFVLQCFGIGVLHFPFCKVGSCSRCVLIRTSEHFGNVVHTDGCVRHDGEQAIDGKVPAAARIRKRAEHTRMPVTKS